MDSYGVRVDKKDSVKNIMEIKLAYILADIWLIRNRLTKESLLDDKIDLLFGDAWIIG